MEEEVLVWLRLWVEMMALSSSMELFWVGEAAWRNVDVSCLVYVGSVCTRRNASKVATHLSATVSNAVHDYYLLPSSEFRFKFGYRSSRSLEGRAVEVSWKHGFTEIKREHQSE